METKQTGRVVFILIVLIAAMFSICSQPWKLFTHAPWSEKLNLKPGIDMVGGTSLLYEIKEPEGGFHGAAGHTLAEDVMESLKKRVDPNGVRNLIWRPQGNNRLEIQLPASPNAEKGKAAAEAFSAAAEALGNTNVRPSEVISAVEKLKGADRDQRLAQIANGSPVRQTLFTTLAKTFDALQDAHTKQLADVEAQKSIEYEKLKSQIDSSNLDVSLLQGVLDAPADQRAKSLADLKNKYADSPARTLAIDNFVKTYDEFAAVKGSIDDANQLKRELAGSGVLEFHIMAYDLPAAVSKLMVNRLLEKGPRVEAGDEVKWFQVDKPEEVQNTVDWNGKHYALAYISKDKSMVNGPGTPPWALESSGRETDSYGAACVGFTFDVQGGIQFGEFTGNNKGRWLAAVLDNKIISAAKVTEKIGRKGTITRGGGYPEADLSYLISTLNAGSLPATLADEPISEHTIGSQLGADNLRAGLIACIFGLVIVAVFLIAYYYVAGVVATFAVLMNVILILGVLAAFNATFTLPGIAGIVLTIGAAVDANVLIFERLREEQHRGLSLRMAMRNAYDHARSAIIDSNATTVITSIILIWLGSEEVKGFGLTLLIGLVSSLFTSLFVTRTIFNILIDKFHIENLGSLPLTFPRWDRLLKPNIDWMKFVPYFCTLSAVLIVAGMASFIMEAKAGRLADIDFASGTQVQFELKDTPAHPKGMDIAELRSIFTKADNPDLPSFSLVSVGNDNHNYEIVTPNVDAKSVRGAVLKVVGPMIKTDLPSKFDHVGETLETAFGSAILPITKVPFVVNGYTVGKADSYIGGAAIVLNDLDPALKAGEIKSRIDSQIAQSRSGDQSQGRFYDFSVVSPHGSDQPARTAIVLVQDSAIPFDKDEGKWREDLVGPMWKLVNEAVDRPATLQKVSNFDAQVAGDAQQAALLSLVLSSLVILAYIWFRFGNLKYGTATVLAMLHDTFLVVGAIGLSHWISNYTPWLAHILLIEPFRVNLTIVAAVLTVMSYSMIDTIVVFDRVRENRGKFGHMSRKIINDSINQTLSRTLLTCGTTIMTVAGMYIVGGPGIHGFTFVLLVGILVGTYSSIAIAAPILLIGGGGDSPKDEPGRRISVGQLQKVPG